MSCLCLTNSYRVNSCVTRIHDTQTRIARSTWSPRVTTEEVFFFDASKAFLRAPTRCGGRFLEEMGGIEEEGRVDFVDMIFQKVLNTTAPQWAPNCFGQKSTK